MTFQVIVLPEAKGDLVEIHLYVARRDSVLHADMLLEKLEEKFVSLHLNPECGHAVPELRRVFVEGFREIHYKPYRIIFQVFGETIYIHAVLDGRRELQEILERRLLG
jgi:toxin ParE1/3/4